MTNEVKNMVVYQSATGAISLKNDNDSETIWATQKQIAQLFDVNVPAIIKHIDNIYCENELDKKTTTSKMEIVQKEGNRSVKRDVSHYNLDMVISVGYRVNSKQATNFRKWATGVLKEHITKGYSINDEFFINQKAKAQEVIDQIRLLSNQNNLISKDNVLDMIEGFTHTWFSLQKYDTDDLPTKGMFNTAINISSDDLYSQVAILKQSLIDSNEATNLFAQEKQKGSLDGILKNVLQSVFGSDVYPTIEEKAAHLLYFVIKNHPFSDGNKRTGAFSFIWFLEQCGFAYTNCITPNVLTTLTLFIAESEPKAKDRVVGLILQLLSFDNS